MRYAKHPVDADGWTDWFKPRQGFEGGHYRAACCDCGLTHEMDFHICDDGYVWLRVRRNERATAQKRRHRQR